MAELRFDRKAFKILKLNPRLLIELGPYERLLAILQAYNGATDKRAARHAIEIIFGSDAAKRLLQILKQQLI
jgi:hypothetical protein